MNGASARWGARSTFTVLLVVALLGALVPGVAFGAAQGGGGVPADAVSAMAIPGAVPVSLPQTLTAGPDQATALTFMAPDKTYALTLAAGDRFIAAGGYSGDVALRLYGPSATSLGGTPIATGTNPGANQLLLDYTVPEGAGGTYYLNAHLNSGLGGGYVLGAQTIAVNVTFQPTQAEFEAIGSAPPESLTVTVTVSGWTGATVGWSLYNIPGWLTITPTSGTAPGTTVLTVDVDTSTLVSGETTSVDVLVDVGEPVFGSLRRALGVPAPDGVLPVQVTVLDPNQPILSVGSTSMSFEGAAGVAEVAAQNLAVSNVGTGTVECTVTAAADWLTLETTRTLVAGVSGPAVEIKPSAANKPAGTYTTNVYVQAEGAQGSPKVVPVSFTVKKRNTSISAFTAYLTKKTWSSATSQPQVKVTGTVVPALAGGPLAGSFVYVYGSYNGATFTKLSPAAILNTTTGAFSWTGPVKAKAYYKAVFSGNGYLNASSYTAVKSVTPYAYLPAPTANSTVYKSKAFTVAGYLYPAHTSTYPVKLNLYRYSSGAWVYKSSVWAKKVTTYSTCVKYQASVTLPTTGTWRIYPEHYDTDHLKTPASAAYGYYKQVVCK